MLDPTVASGLVMLPMAKMSLVRCQQSLSADGAKTPCWIDDRLVTAMTFINELITAQDAIRVVLRHR
ncbi:MAG: hypothetical protein OEM41_04625 [Ignavibacteria bacterium]|nr:hypothetical protein [Ignavibacteria bacterium]